MSMLLNIPSNKLVQSYLDFYANLKLVHKYLLFCFCMSVSIDIIFDFQTFFALLYLLLNYSPSPNISYISG